MSYLDDVTSVSAVIVITIAAALLTYCAEAQEQPLTPRDLTLNAARAAALSEPHDPVHCFQERRYRQAHVCITEAEWLRRGKR